MKTMFEVKFENWTIKISPQCAPWLAQKMIKETEKRVKR